MRTVRRCSKKLENAGRRRSGAQPFGRRTFAAAALAALALSPCARADETASATAASLELVNLDLLDSRDGYAIPADSRYFPGETVHLYFQIKGYRVSNDYRVNLEYRLEALDPDGKRIYGAEGGRFDTDLAPQDEEWMPVVRYSPEIPARTAGGGTYKIEIEVRGPSRRGGGSRVRADRRRRQPRRNVRPSRDSEFRFCESVRRRRKARRAALPRGRGNLGRSSTSRATRPAKTILSMSSPTCA